MQLRPGLLAAGAAAVLCVVALGGVAVALQPSDRPGEVVEDVAPIEITPQPTSPTPAPAPAPDQGPAPVNPAPPDDLDDDDDDGDDDGDDG